MKEHEELYEAVDEIFQSERKKLEAEQKESLERLVLDARNVFGTKSGRRILWWILSRTGFHSSTWTGRALDQAHFDGQRMVGAEVLSLALKADPRIYEKLLNDKLT